MSCFDLLGTGSLQLIIGWESGKVELTNFKDHHYIRSHVILKKTLG